MQGPPDSNFSKETVGWVARGVKPTNRDNNCETGNFLELLSGLRCRCTSPCPVSLAAPIGRRCGGLLKSGGSVNSEFTVP